jgi:hypothetical protein
VAFNWHFSRQHLVKNFVKHFVAHQPAAAVDYTLFFAGTWRFYDERQKRHHQLRVSSQLEIKIDGHPLAGQVTQLNRQQLVFLDQYGYELRITANDQQPTTIYDEADHRTYPIMLVDQPE